MFFKREKPKEITFDQQLAELSGLGYRVSSASGGNQLAAKGNLGAHIAPDMDGKAAIHDVGLVIRGELALLTDVGYQKIFLTPSGHKTPALAEHLHALHEFTEDLREALALPSLYNESLGTINEKHLYDRVEDRDSGAVSHPWEKR
jgi:hypothetical protein